MNWKGSGRALPRVGVGGSGGAAAEGFAARRLLADLETSQVSIFAVQAQRNELRSRMQMTDVVNRRKIRHAHMVNINRQIMLEGMRADFQKVDRHQRESGGDGAQGAAGAGEDGRGHGSDGGFESELPVVEDQRDYHPRKSGGTCPEERFLPRRAK